MKLATPSEPLGAEPLTDGLVWALTTMVAVSLFLNVVTYRLMRSTLREAANMHAEIFQKLNASQ